VQQIEGFDVLALILLLVGVVGLGVAFLYWFPWSRRRLQAVVRMTGRSRWSAGSSQ
jgi:hypothetical protein